ncbi:hypothetical protein HYALB_00013139 [Hymenoscyphus albidus]|uniref:Uncharacterized protein n=1 Tax=Hymenoscyphus albidus TaxID=595503 RepID=A0A9N9LTD4_9HELO|nr:hypothetical protein HYALB_00013139 [Hymenoscyphus albidus]
MFCNMRILLTLTLANCVLSHITLESPKPFKVAADGLSNPLAPSGANFPCQGKVSLPDGGPTVMTIGQEQKTTFSGLATHGGGSCQISLLKGFEPSKENADFRVIKTQYGCLTNSKGNLDGGKANPMTFVIPDSVEPGDYSGSWTWQSEATGELYQMCFPITVVAKKRSRIERGKPEFSPNVKRGLEDLPPVWLANLGEVTGTCSVKPQQQIVEFPEPGKDVEHSEGDKKLFKAECNGNPFAKGGVTKPSNPSSSATPSSAPAKKTTSKTPAPSATSTSAPSKPTTSNKPTSTKSTTRTPKATSSASPSSSKASAPTVSTPPAPSASSGSTGMCEEGKYLCVNGHMFSVCTGGRWTGPQPLAANTHCEGEVGELKIVNE